MLHFFLSKQKALAHSIVITPPWLERSVATLNMSVFCSLSRIEMHKQNGPEKLRLGNVGRLESDVCIYVVYFMCVLY